MTPGNDGKKSRINGLLPVINRDTAPHLRPEPNQSCHLCLTHNLIHAAIMKAFRRFWIVGCLAIVAGISHARRHAGWHGRRSHVPGRIRRRDPLDETGHPIPGFTAGDCVEVIGNEIDRTVRWTSGSDVSTLADRIVRLRFVMKDADLYALRFADEGGP